MYLGHVGHFHHCFKDNGIQLHIKSDMSPISLCTAVTHNEKAVAHFEQFCSAMTESIQDGNDMYNCFVGSGTDAFVVSDQIPLGCPLKSCTSEYLNLISSYDFSNFDFHSDVSQIYVYVDGGFKKDEDIETTWAITSIVESHNGEQMLKHVSNGVVDFNSMSVKYMG